MWAILSLFCSILIANSYGSPIDYDLVQPRMLLPSNDSSIDGSTVMFADQTYLRTMPAMPGNENETLSDPKDMYGQPTPSLRL
ncbi:hypothetical protein DMENIID0001_010430 [Sergentomyia squamirostris]